MTLSEELVELALLSAWLGGVTPTFTLLALIVGGLTKARLPFTLHFETFQVSTFVLSFSGLLSDLFDWSRAPSSVGRATDF